MYSSLTTVAGIREIKALPPSFIEVLLGVIDVDAGEPFAIECSFEGKPTPSIEWTKDGQPLLPSSRINLCYDGESASLRIASSQVSDSGRYCCNILNLAGVAEGGSNLNVFKRKNSGKCFSICLSLKNT
ncbi:unnamed protein product [Soboliphyme baturini]|uniref:Ig-like domain-containing protein n=1 Tax=Soboliphyme baturini TaxID=241478 RepID=A0A183IS87_9BILA|nr:unnamed protein product [Soboliphyme baturini]